MKLYPVTVTLDFELEASSEEVVQNRADAIVDALITFTAPKPLPKWWPDLEAPEIEVGEGEEEEV